MKFSIATLFLLVLLAGCTKTKWATFPASDPALHWQGRILEDPQGHKWLFGSAACLRFRFKGDSCKIRMRNRASGEEYNYISFVIDGIHTQRIKINFDSLEALTVMPEKATPFHDVELYKETEAKNGAIEISGIDAMGLEALNVTEQKKIEFIGNSITAGMSADPSQIPCGEGKWYDQHNTYDAFGPVVARKLHCDFLLSAYSGLGMYRNWSSDYPVMKDVYESIMLDPDPNSPRWNYDTFKPDVIALCVGANDFSDGDGVTPRPPFDSTKFISAYISFLKNIHHHQPQAQFLLLNGPVNSPEHDAIFRACLSAVKNRAEKEMPELMPVMLHFFKLIHPQGCGGHPDVPQHAAMADEIEPVLNGMLGNKE